MSERSKTSSRRKESAAQSKAKKATDKTKPRSAQKQTSKKPLSTHSASDHGDSDGSPKVFSRKKKNEKQGKQKTSTLTKSSSKDKAGIDCELSILVLRWALTCPSAFLRFLIRLLLWLNMVLYNVFFFFQKKGPLL